MFTPTRNSCSTDSEPQIVKWVWWRPPKVVVVKYPHISHKGSLVAPPARQEHEVRLPPATREKPTFSSGQPSPTSPEPRRGPRSPQRRNPWAASCPAARFFFPPPPFFSGGRELEGSLAKTRRRRPNRPLWFRSRVHTFCFCK